MCLVDAFESYRPLLFTIASRLLDNATEAEDMVRKPTAAFKQRMSRRFARRERICAGL